MLTYTCNLCSHSYPVEITFGGQINYNFDGRKIQLKSENDDCYECQQEIQLEESTIKEQARAKVKAKKNQVPPVVNGGGSKLI